MTFSIRIEMNLPPTAIQRANHITFQVIPDHHSVIRLGVSPDQTLVEGFGMGLFVPQGIAGKYRIKKWLESGFFHFDVLNFLKSVG